MTLYSISILLRLRPCVPQVVESPSNRTLLEWAYVRVATTTRNAKYLNPRHPDVGQECGTQVDNGQVCRRSWRDTVFDSNWAMPDERRYRDWSEPVDKVSGESSAIVFLGCGCGTHLDPRRCCVEACCASIRLQIRVLQRLLNA